MTIDKGFLTVALKERDRFLGLYTTNKRGMITSPGKFEGEKIYVPYYWNLGLEGMAYWKSLSGNRVFGFNITPEEKAAFSPLLKNRRTVKLYERDDGFVIEV